VWKLRSSALRLFLVYSFCSALFYQLIFTVNMLYYILVARLDPLQLVLVGTTLETSVFLFEIPTGVVADSFSRRKSVILGVFLVGLSFLLNGLFPIFAVIALAQVLWGLGYTFTSGALQAWISDEIGEKESSLAFLRGSRMEQWGGLVGVLLSMGLAIVSLRAPIIIGGALFIVLGIYLLFRMPETGFAPGPLEQQNHWNHLAATFSQGISMVKVRPALIGILGVGFLFGMYSEGYDRLWTAHLVDTFTFPMIPGLEWVADPIEFNLVIWLGLLKAVVMIASAIAISQIEKRLHHPKMNSLIHGLTLCSAILVLCLLGFALAHNLVLMLILVVMIGMVREIINPIYTAWVNQRLDSSVRATVISMSSQVDAVGQIAGGPVVGVIARSVSISTGLLTSGLILAPVLLLLGFQRNRENEND
jgi:DHA3 family tetracycline resistance protein-like MFS transporter